MSGAPHWESHEHILQFLAGDLPEEEIRKRTVHLSECDPCREQLAGVQRLLRIAPEEAPADGPRASERYAELRRRLSAEERVVQPAPKPVKPSWFSWPRLVPALAGGLAAVVAVVLMVNRGPSDRELVAQVFETIEAGAPGGEVAGLRAYSPAAPAGVVTRGVWSIPPQDLRQAEQTLRAETMSAERYNALGYLRLHAGQFALAGESYDRAVALDPGNLEAVLGSVVSRLAPLPTGSEARGATLRATEADLAQALAGAGADSGSLEAAWYTYALIAQELGMTETAQDALRTYEALNPPESWRERLRDRLRP